MADAGPPLVLRFPVAGTDTERAYSDQRPRPVAEGVYGRTTIRGVNVRGFEASADRRRGGSRPGLAKLFAERVTDEDWVVQNLDVLVHASASVTVAAGVF